MRKILYTIIISLTVAVGGYAQPRLDGILDIGSHNINAGEEFMTVSFNVTVAPKAVKSDYQFTVVPVLTDGYYKVSLAPIIIQGRRVKVNEARYELASGSTVEYDNVIFMKNGETTRYMSITPTQLWMQGARLVIESEMAGCCTQVEYQSKVLAENISIPIMYEDPIVEIVEVIEQKEVMSEPVTKLKSKADQLADIHTFVIPVSEYDYSDPFKAYNENRDNSLVIYFRQGSSKIDITYLDNARTVHDLINAVNMIQASDDSEVKYMLVAGFASPEGRLEANEKLAFERARNVKEYVAERTALSPEKVKVFNGSVDWIGLRKLVEDSNIPDKDRVLYIIDYIPVWDSQAQIGRHGELMRLNNGSTYRYMYREFFPKLRNGASIKVYYENK